MMLRRDQPHARVVIPDHKQVRIGTLRRIVADACQDRDVLLADVVRLGLAHLRIMRDIDPDAVPGFGGA